MKPFPALPCQSLILQSDPEGFLAVWGGLWVPSGPDDPGNTILDLLLDSQGQQVRLLSPKPFPNDPSSEGVILRS